MKMSVHRHHKRWVRSCGIVMSAFGWVHYEHESRQIVNGSLVIMYSDILKCCK